MIETLWGDITCGWVEGERSIGDGLANVPAEVSFLILRDLFHSLTCHTGLRHLLLIEGLAVCGGISLDQDVEVYHA